MDKSMAAGKSKQVWKRQRKKNFKDEKILPVTLIHMSCHHWENLQPEACWACSWFSKSQWPSLHRCLCRDDTKKGKGIIGQT